MHQQNNSATETTNIYSTHDPDFAKSQMPPLKIAFGTKRRETSMRVLKHHKSKLRKAKKKKTQAWPTALVAAAMNSRCKSRDPVGAWIRNRATGRCIKKRKPSGRKTAPYEILLWARKHKSGLAKKGWRRKTCSGTYYNQEFGDRREYQGFRYKGSKRCYSRKGTAGKLLNYFFWRYPTAGRKYRRDTRHAARKGSLIEGF